MGIRLGAAGACGLVACFMLAACGGGGGSSSGGSVPDTAPDAFSFAAQTGVPLSTAVVSVASPITGINAAAPVSVTGGEYSIGCGASFTSAAGTITDNQTVCVRELSAATPATTTTATLTVGGVSASFSATTVAADTTPDAFAFTPVGNAPLSTAQTSNTVTITGINSAAPVSVTGGEYSIGCGASFTSAAGSITDNQTVCVRQVSAAVPATATSTTLTVGGVSASFTTTTVPADTTPDAFAFTPVNDVAFNTTQTSNTVTITGINTAVAVSVAGGEYSIGCGASFTTAAGSMSDNQTVCVRHVNGNAPDVSVTTTLTVGSVQANFTSTTDGDILQPYINGSGQLYGYLARTRSSRLIDSALGNADDFVVQPHLLYSATVDPGTGHVSRRQPQSAIYVKAGRLYRAALANGGSIQPVAVSAFTDVCGVAKLLPDYAAPDQSLVVLQRAGPGNDCTNYSQSPSIVHASASTSDTGVTLGLNDGYDSSVEAIHDATGGLAAVIVSERSGSNRMLRRYDPAFATAKDLMVLNSGFLPLMQELWTRGMYVSADSPTIGGQLLVRYDEQGQSATMVHAFPNGFFNVIATDAGNVYAGDGNQLVRIPHSATDAGAAAVVTTLPNPGGSLMIVVDQALSTDGHVIMNVPNLGDASDAGVWTVFGSDNQGTALHLFQNGVSAGSPLGDNIFANDFGFSSGNTAAIISKPDGSGQSSVTGAQWAGRTVPKAYDQVPAGIGMNAAYVQGPQDPTFLLRVDSNGGTLTFQAVDPQSGTVSRSLGTLNGAASVLLHGIDALALCEVTHSDGNGGQITDVYGIDFNTANSLTALNNAVQDNRILQ